MVFINVTGVLATYLEDDNVLLRVFQLCYVLTSVMFRNGRPSQLISYWQKKMLCILRLFKSKLFQSSLTYLPDRVPWSASATLDPNIPDWPATEAQN